MQRGRDGGAAVDCTRTGESAIGGARIVAAVLAVIVIAACSADSDLLGAGGASGSDQPETWSAAADPVAMTKRAARVATIAALQHGAPAAFEFAALANEASATALNPQNAFQVSVTDDGLEVFPGVAEPTWSLTLRWTGIGRGQAIEPTARLRSPGAGPAISRNRASLVRTDGTEEWYLNGPIGIQQGFELPERPHGEGKLVFEIAVTGDLHPVLAAGGDEVLLRDGDDHVALHYSDLNATDADSRLLDAHLAVAGATIQLIIDDRDAAYPLSIDPLVWDEQKKIMASDGAGSDYFGSAVGISGDFALSGAWHHTEATLTMAGAAYVYLRNQGGLANWGQLKKLVAGNIETNAYFGQALAIDGEWILVAAEGEDTAASDAGRVYAYRQNSGGTNAWGMVDALQASDASSGDRFGSDVAVSGNKAVIGAYSDDNVYGSNAGAAYFFHWNGTTWFQQDKALPGSLGADDRFGDAVAIAGDYAVIGAYGDDDAGTDTGAAYVYRWDGSTWYQQVKLFASDPEGSSDFSRAVAITTVGTNVIVAVGAPLQDVDASTANAGAVYVYEKDYPATDAWGMRKKVVPEDLEAGDLFGYSVSISGDWLLAGSMYEDEAGATAGAAYLFQSDLGGTGAWGQFQKILASDATGNDRFGCTVDITTGRAIVGALYEDEQGANAGAAYVFGYGNDVGDGCNWNSECALGFCRDDFCCSTSCDGVCETCDGSETAPLSATGECGYAAPYTNPRGDCTAPMQCDGAGACKLPDGEACNVDGECVSGFCRSGFCCSTVCSETCETCAEADGAPADGTCGFIAFGLDPYSQCTNGACDGSGGCLIDDGYPCTTGTQCFSGNCVDDVCCVDGGCNECASCDVAGSEGNCTGDPGLDNTACGDGVPTECSDADICLNGACDPNDKGPGTACGEAATECVNQDTCDGTGTCIDNGFVASGLGCGDGSDTACSDPDTCDGAGTCLPNHEPTSVECAPSNGPCDAPENCDGSGACDPDIKRPPGDPGSPSCSPYVCDGSSDPCPTSCTTSNECATNFYCDGASCVSKKATGVACTLADECLTNFCVDGYCCENDCTSSCYACSFAKNGSSNGLCQPVTSGDDFDGDCGFYERCDGSGTCKLIQGQICTLASECLSTHCVDGHCCDTECAEGCDLCNDPAAEGTCLLRPDGAAGSDPECGNYLCDGVNPTCPVTCADHADCIDGYYCGAGNVCVAAEPDGTACTADRQCQNSNCVDGYCCDTACGGQCDRCDLSGSVGVCTVVPDSDPGSPACDPYLCDGTLSDCPTSCADGADCVGTSFCNASSECEGLKGLGSVCAVGDECNSGNCVDNRCCSAASCGQCESCNVSGSEGDCTGDPLLDDTACGDPTEEECDHADVCAGGVCSDNLEPNGGPCGDQGIECLNNDTCDGAGSCVDRGFESSGAPCGDSSNSECDGADTCDGGGNCQTNLAASGDPCGDQGVECWQDDTCDGAGSCVDNGYSGTSVACGDSADTECTDPDTCDGSGSCDPHDAASGDPCGDQGVECLVDDTCDGSGSCTNNGYVASGQACGDPTNDDCTNPDTCDGSGTCLDNHAAADAACGDATDDDCTDPDTCDGSGTCLDNHAAADTACGDSADTECTDPDTCDGSGSCLDNHAASGAACGDTGVPCHVDDTCDGAGTCTDNGLVAQDTACGDSADTDCTDPDTCDDAGNCLDNHAAADTACGDTTDDECTDPDTCDGSGTCLDNHAASGDPCGDQGVDCHVDDTCDGAGTCTDNGLEAADTACGDTTDDDCTDPDTCDDSGNCLENHADNGTPCPQGTCADGACEGSGGAGGAGQGGAGQGGAGTGGTPSTGGTGGTTGPGPQGVGDQLGNDAVEIREVGACDCATPGSVRQTPAPVRLILLGLPLALVAGRRRRRRAA